MSRQDGTPKTYPLNFTYRPRLLAEHFGGRKYSRSVRALSELVANSFDANARSVTIDVQRNDLGRITAVIVSDDGHGISPEDLRDRFVVVGVDPIAATTSTRFSQLGIGRLAVYRIGSLSEWTSVSRRGPGPAIRAKFTLSTETPDKLTVTEEVLKDFGSTGTTVEITNLRDADGEGLTPSVIRAELQAQFCSYLLGNPDRRITIQGEELDLTSLIVSDSSEEIPSSTEIPAPATLKHLLLTQSIERSRFPAPLLFSGKGRTVASATIEEVPSPNYLGIVDCPYLDEIVTANREALVELDTGFAHLKSEAIRRVEVFGRMLRADSQRRFIERARTAEYYPFKDSPTDPVTTVRRDVYDVVLEKVHERVNLERMSRKQQAILFKLLERSLDNDDLIEVLKHMLDLGDEEIEIFRKVLERTRLGSIIKLTAEVASRLTFLDILHQLIYGDIAKHVKERSQLHRILEPQCWIFGQRYHLASSDKSFRTVVRKHRKAAGLDDAGSSVDVSKIAGVEDIPDLFLTAVRDYAIEPKHHHLLVELKSPKTSLGRKECEQVRRYAETILESHEFDKTSTCWDLFLVSGKATKEIERDRNQKDAPHGQLWAFERCTVWAFEWSELISRAKEEMQLIRDHLERTSTDLSVSEYLREEFPEILGQVQRELDATPEGAGASRQGRVP